MTLICRGCGCTDDRACPGGCSWVTTNPPICSACVDEGLSGGIGDAAVLDEPGDYCPASETRAFHKPIWTSASGGHCVACGQEFVA